MQEETQGKGFQIPNLGRGKFHSEIAVITSRDLGIFMGKIFECANYIQFTGNTKQSLCFEVFGTERLFLQSSPFTVQWNACVNCNSFCQNLFYITKLICQLLRKFPHFLLQMIEGEIISCFKCKVGMIKISV